MIGDVTLDPALDLRARIAPPVGSSMTNHALRDLPAVWALDRTLSFRNRSKNSVRLATAVSRKIFGLPSSESDVHSAVV